MRTTTEEGRGGGAPIISASLSLASAGRKGTEKVQGAARRQRDGISLLLATTKFWVGIHGCRNCIYDRKIYNSVVDFLMKLAQFWYFGHVSKSLVAKSTTAMNPNPDFQSDLNCFV